jgi:hypothetical protein
MLKIDSVTMPEPTEISLAYRNEEKREKNALGKTLKDVIAYDKVTANISYFNLTPTQIATLRGAVSGKGFVTAEFDDPDTGTTITGTFEPMGQAVASIRRKSGAIMGWKDFKLILDQQ